MAYLREYPPGRKTRCRLWVSLLTQARLITCYSLLNSLYCVLFAQTLSSVEVLECSVCYERYDDNKRCPRLLSNCGHTFCTYCLEQLLKNGTIACPQDRKDVAVSAGVGGLPKNFALLDVLLANSHKRSDTPVNCDTCGEEGHLATSFCLECKENMCDVAAQFHTRLKLSRDHRVVSIAELKANPHLAAIPVFCSEHNEPFRYFDNDCGQVICRDCFALKHNGHKCCSLAEASAQSRQELEALASKARAIAAKLKEAKNRAMTIVSDLNWKKNLEEARIHAFFEEVSAFLFLWSWHDHYSLRCSRPMGRLNIRAEQIIISCSSSFTCFYYMTTKVRPLWLADEWECTICV